MVRKQTLLSGVAAIVAVVGLGSSGCSEPASEARTLEHLSPVYTVDREYRSMTGPTSTQQVVFAEAASKELLWITGYRAVMVGADGESSMPQEFMCHSNLDFDAARHGELFGLPVYHTNRLFTLSQGQLEIEFPKGFGLPYFAHEALSLTTQVLNLNPDGQTHEVRHKVTIEYVLERDLQQPMKPLFMTSGWGLVLLDGPEGYFGVADPKESEHGPGCLPGEAAGHDEYSDAFNREFSGEIPTASVDREQMKRVFINLIDNALEAIQRKGQIEIVTRYLKKVRLMRIEVADDGPGIDPADKARLFLPYFSTKKRGTGLGLAIVNRIISDHEGTVRFEDNQPKGSRFIIELPVRGAREAA